MAVRANKNIIYINKIAINVVILDFFSLTPTYFIIPADCSSCSTVTVLHGKAHQRITSKWASSSALSLCPSLVQHRAIPSSTSLLMVRLLSAIHSRQLLYASKAFYVHHTMRTKCNKAF